MAQKPPPILEMRGIVKEFPGVRALDDVTMTVCVAGTFIQYVERTELASQPL